MTGTWTASAPAPGAGKRALIVERGHVRGQPICPGKSLNVVRQFEPQMDESRPEGRLANLLIELILALWQGA
jgi:hypothetical protein